jgi:hypothetical protein
MVIAVAGGRCEVAGDAAFMVARLARASIGATDYAEIGRLGAAVANWRALISKFACEQLP